MASTTKEPQLGSPKVAYSESNFIQSPTVNMNEDKSSTGIENSISSLINDMQISTLNDFYDIESSVFKKRIEKLNLKFFWESEGLTNQRDIPKPYNKLFLILFKQINLYTEEIDRLNNIIKEKNKNEKLFKDKLYEFTQKEKERILTKQMLKNYQKTNKVLEKRLKEKTVNEERLRLDIERLKQQHHFAKDIGISTPMAATTVNISQAKKKVHIKAPNLKRNCYSIETKYRHNKSRKKKSVKKRNETVGNYLNNSMVISSSKNTRGNDNMSQPDSAGVGDFGANEEIINKCLEHYGDEIENLDEIERFLLKQKKDIKEAFMKLNISSLKNTLKGIPR